MSEQEVTASDAMDLMEEPTSWPKTIGIISMVWAGIGLSCAGCGLVMTGLSTSMMPPAMQAEPLPPGMGLTLANSLQMGLGIVFSIVLFAAGFATMRRSMAGRLLHLVWSGISLLWIPVSLIMIFQQDAAMKRWLADNPDSVFAKQSGAGSNIGVMIGLTITLVFALYPLFIFVWFMFIKKTKESFGPEPVKDYI